MLAWPRERLTMDFTESQSDLNGASAARISSLNTSIMRDLSGEIYYWNRAAERHYGWSKKEAVGQVSHHLLGTVFPSPLDEINNILLRHGYWEGWLIHTLSDGRRVRVKSRWEILKDDVFPAVKVLETNRAFETVRPENA